MGVKNYPANNSLGLENLISTSFLIPILRKSLCLKKLWGKMGMNKISLKGDFFRTRIV